MRRASLGLLGLLLAGCATTASPPMVVDTFCASPASKKRVWNPDTDTVEHMRESVVFNRYIDMRCGRPK
jgi:hypothetical protein